MNVFRILGLLTALLFFVGCQEKKSDPTVASVGFPAVVTDATGESTYTAAPARAVVFDGNLIRLFLALGLEDRLVGYWDSGSTFSEEEKQKLARSKPIDAKWPGPSKEVIAGMGPDFVLGGWGYGFSEDSGLTPATLQALGIQSYAILETTPSPAPGTTGTVETTFRDIRNLGRIFGVSEKAEALVATIEGQIRSVQQRLATLQASKPKVFVYDDIGESSPLTAGMRALVNDLIRLAGGDNIFGDLDKDWATVSWEEVIQRNPDVILVMDTDWESAAVRIDRLKALPILAKVKAIASKNFITIHYRQAVIGIENGTGVERIAAGLYPLSPQ